MSNDEAATCPSHLTQNRVDPSDPRNIPPGAAAQKAKQTDKVYYTSRVYVVLALPSPIINARAGKKKKKKAARSSLSALVLCTLQKRANASHD